MKIYKIFLSSSMTGDLDKERSLVQSEVEKINFTLRERQIKFELLMFENLPVGVEVKEQLSNWLDECDIFILILNAKYSNYVKQEFQKAAERSKTNKSLQILTFIKDSPIELSAIDFQSITQLAEFKNEVLKDRLVIYYNTIESFRLKIIESLYAISEKRRELNRTKENELKDLRVFISYNHKDSKVAEEIKKKLTDLGINVIIDSEALSSGMDIESFIKESILNTDLTISVVSKNSLLSSWVAMESIESFSKETRSSIKFLPFVLDKTFLDRKFTGEAIDTIDLELDEIVEILKKRFEKKTGFADLYGEFKRYLALRNNIDEIVRRLRESLFVDVSQGNFEDGIGKLLKSYPDLIGHRNFPDTMRS
jgi:hypothetical protein